MSAEPRLRILMVSARFSPFVGGTEIHTGRVAAELVKRGHSVTVLTTDLNGSLPDREEIDGIDVIRVRAYPRWSDLYIAPGVRAVVGGSAWDVVHVQGYHTAVAPLALQAAQKAGLSTIVTFHSGGHSSRLRSLLRPLQVGLLRRYLRGASALIGVSEFEAGLFGRRIGTGAGRIQIIPNGVDRSSTGAAVSSSLEQETTSGVPASIEGGAKREDMIILSAGRLVRYKGHHRIIQAMPKILNTEPRARLLILGRGPYERALRRMVRRLGIDDRVSFDSVDADQRDRLDSVFQSASVAVVLSDYESHGMVAHEALNAGLPLAVLDRSALSELAATGSASAVPPRATSGEVAEIVLRCLNDSSAPQDEATAPRTETETEIETRTHTWSGITDLVETLYQKVVANDGRPAAAGNR